MKKNKHFAGFTLIELLMVIAIIGILAGILIPAVGMVRERATIATSKARLSQYLSAIAAFKGEYAYYPFSDLLDGSGQLDLSTASNSEAFYETLMARDIDNPATTVSREGNRRRIQFYSFTPDELADGTDSSVTENTIIDGFGNNQIFIVFDDDDDGVVEVPDPDGSDTDTIEVRTGLTAYVSENDSLNAPAYYIYE